MGWPENNISDSIKLDLKLFESKIEMYAKQWLEHSELHPTDKRHVSGILYGFELSLRCLNGDDDLIKRLVTIQRDLRGF